jgi:hypothetical protein
MTGQPNLICSLYEESKLSYHHLVLVALGSIREGVDKSRVLQEVTCAGLSWTEYVSLRRMQRLSSKCIHLRTKETHCLSARLIDLGMSGGQTKPHLWISEESHKHMPYVALSYHWGKSPAVLLTQASLPALCEEIPVYLLPKTNQDAVQITRFLGIRYLWIDVFCIIQDLEADWHHESKNMETIFQSSYCTISASMATTGEQGCFMNRSPLQARFHRPFSPSQNGAVAENGP